MKIKPAGHRVLVRLKETSKELEEKSEGGIIVEVKDNDKVEAEQRATQEAYVERLGFTAFKAFDDGEPWCKVGDLVIITRYSGEDREDPKSGEVYRIINDEDVIAIIEE